jgi:hypothetical protein
VIVDVILPCLNEAPALPWILGRMPAGFRPIRRRTGLGIRDLGPMRAAGREALLGLNLADRRFGYPLEMVLNAAAAGWRVSEVDVTYRPRVGKSKVTGTVGGCVRTVRDMSQVLAR